MLTTAASSSSTGHATKAQEPSPACQVVSLPMPTGYPQDDSVRVFLVRFEGKVVLIDTSTSFQNHDELLKAHLDRHAVTRLDYLLLTHCHPDHCGNAQVVKQWFPEVKVVIHQNGEERLRLGTEGVKASREDCVREFYRRMGNPIPQGAGVPSYGLPPGEYPKRLPLRADWILSADIEFDGIQAITTPGHSTDHVCYGIAGHFFGGDTVLNFVPGMEDIWLGQEEGMSQFIESVNKLEALSDRFHTIHTFHAGPVESLEQWAAIIVKPRLRKKSLKLLQTLRQHPNSTLFYLMQAMHGNLSRIIMYIYSSQYAGILYSMLEQGVLSRWEDEKGAWHYIAMKENWNGLCGESFLN